MHILLLEISVLCESAWIVFAKHLHVSTSWKERVEVVYVNRPTCEINNGLEAHQGLQSSIKGHRSLHGHFTGLRYGGQTPVQKITQTLLLHIWTGHKPVQTIQIFQAKRSSTSV